MNQSDSIKEIATALAKAQGEGNRFTESSVIVEAARGAWPIRRANQNDGRTTLQRFLEKLVFGASECWYWRGALHQLGYGLMNALGESKAHRVSYRLFHGAIPEGLDVLHRCDVRNCVNPDHLFAGTHADNMRDMANKGRGKTTPRPGEKHHSAKLNAVQVAQIRELYRQGGVTMKQLAEQFGVGTMNVSRIINNQLWRQQ